MPCSVAPGPTRPIPQRAEATKERPHAGLRSQQAGRDICIYFAHAEAFLGLGKQSCNATRCDGHEVPPGTLPPLEEAKALRLRC